jgi:hypothetical protein
MEVWMVVGGKDAAISDSAIRVVIVRTVAVRAHACDARASATPEVVFGLNLLKHDMSTGLGE